MSNAIFLEGETVTLRPVGGDDDLTFLWEGVNHPAVRRYVGQSFPTSLRRERRYFEEVDDSPDAIQALVTVDDERVGVVEFDPVDRETGVAEFAIWLHPDHRGGGRAREATELFVGYAFDELRVHKVTANAYEANRASRSLLQSVGFVEEGVGREDSFFEGDYHDTYYYGLLEREWRARQDGSEDV